MAKTLDLRTYVHLERAFVRRLQRSWRQQSASTYAAITQACLDHRWDEARRLVTDLDLTEVGTQNREWITYMLRAFAVFGAGLVAKKKPSFVGVGSFDTFLQQTTANVLQSFEYRGTAQVQAEALQAIAEDEAKTKAVKWDEALHPRDTDGQFTNTGLTETVYHGTGQDFSTFDFTRGGEATGAKNGVLGAFFTTDINKAEGLYAGRRGTLMEARLKLTHPARFKGLEYDNDASALVNHETAQYVEKPLDDLTEEDFLAWRDFLVRQGHDGIEVTLYHGEKDYIAFDAKQIVRTKWDEAEHPRDKEGQFTEKDVGYTGGLGEMDQLEGGGGPIRAEWVRRNKASMEAFDALQTAREAHDQLEAPITALFKANGTAEDIRALETKIHADPAYQQSVRRLEVLEQNSGFADQALKALEPAMRKEVVTNLSSQVARSMGVNPSAIHVVDKDPSGFTVGDKQFTEAGHYNPVTKQVELNARNISYGEAQGVKGTTAHELSHLIWHATKDASDQEFQRYLAKAVQPGGTGYTPWHEERFDTPGRLKPAYREEFAREFPASAALATLSDGAFFTGISERMIHENGHSAYARSYWAPDAVKSRGGYDSAINETVAEVTRWMTYPSSWRGEGGTPSPTSPWVKLTKAMHQWYAGQTAARDQSAATLARIRALAPEKIA